MSESDGPTECAEYVLGTLPIDERLALERELARDPALRAELVHWEDWLAGLNDAIPTVAPTQSLWPAIERRLRVASNENFPAPFAVTNDRAALATVDLLRPIRRSRGRWRAATLAFGAIAAGLALFIGRGTFQPPAATSYLAVVNRGGDLPALLVHVDTGNDTVSVRSLAAETPPDHVLELWYVAGGQAPRSIGLLNQPLTRAALPASAHAADIAGATLAVSVEPKGGSPTGAPTGQVIYSGKLIRDQ